MCLHSVVFYILVVLYFAPVVQGQVLQPAEPKFLSEQQLKEDFNIYKNIVIETHAGLYRYSSKPEIEARLDIIAQSLNQPLPVYDFYKQLALFNASIKCAHSYVMPSQDIQELISTKLKIFPLYLYPVEDAYHVLLNGTGNPNIQPGMKVISINGIEISKIVKELKKYAWVDGNTISAQENIVENYIFGLLYYYIFDRPNFFDLKLSSESDTIEVSVAALNYRQIAQNYTKNKVNATILKLYNKNERRVWKIEFPKEVPNTAKLTIGEFGFNSSNEEEASVAFCKFMDGALLKLRKKSISNLIIELRDNRGGWDILGKDLFTYLAPANQEYGYYREQFTRTRDSDYLKLSDLSEEEVAQVTEGLEPFDDYFRVPTSLSWGLQKVYSKNNRFEGKVYILMNSRSASTTSEFLAMAKSNNLGILIGEESGGAYGGGNGSTYIKTTLPNSGFAISVPLVRYLNDVKEIQPLDRGVLPDYEVTHTLEDILSGYDRPLEFTYELIRSNENHGK